MKKRDLIVVVASGIMLFAFLALPVLSVKTFGFSLTMFKILINSKSLWFSIVLLLMLLAPLYLIFDKYREKLKFMAKIVIPSKIATLLPIILFLLFLYGINSTSRGVTPTKDVGFYFYFLAAIVVAILPFIKHGALEDK